MDIVIVGHVDHGKSTVIGRLLADTGSLPQGKLDAVRRECERTGKPFEYAFLLDALSDEQDQGITIDTARCFFKTASRDYVIIDAPGHIEFLKNMISGAARAEAAVLVIDAKEGVRENSRRHGYLLAMLGVRQVVVCVNKMDLVGRSQQTFQAIETEYRAFLEGIGARQPARFIPIAAIDGDNLATRATQMPWYDGPTLLEALDNFAKTPSAGDQALRMPVQAVYKFTSHGDDRRIIAGRIEAGRLSVGDRVVFSPSNKSTTVRSIEMWNAPPRTQADAGWSIGFTLAEEIYVTRGEVVSHVEQAPQVGTRFRANVIWLGKKPFVTGRDYKLKLGTTSMPVQLAGLSKVIDASALSGVLDKDHVGRHDVADVVLETKQPIAFDLRGGGCEATGRFVIVDGYEIAGGGIVIERVEDQVTALRDEARRRDLHWVRGSIAPAERAARYGHGAALIMFVGREAERKHSLALAVERALHDAKRHVYLLDGTNVLLGVDQDLVFGDSQDELVRRFGEVANLLLDAGLLVVSTTEAIGLADVAAVQTLLPDARILVIDVDSAGDSTLPCDARVSGSEDSASVVAAVTTLLAQAAIFTGG
jgi:bifunctional enzyme CysN/CysC